MTATKENCNELFQEAAADLIDRGYEPKCLTNLLKLGDLTRTAYNNVYDKRVGNRTANRSDALAIQLLVLLDDAGFDLDGFAFDEAGQLVEAPAKQATKRGKKGSSR